MATAIEAFEVHEANYRRAESSLVSIIERRPVAGASHDLRGTDLEGAPGAQCDRVRAVVNRKQLAGTRQQYLGDTATAAEMRPKVESLLARNTDEIERLQARIDELTQENAAAAESLAVVEERIEKMTFNRRWLEGYPHPKGKRRVELLPPFVTSQLHQIAVNRNRGVEPDPIYEQRLRRFYTSDLY